MWAWDGCQAVPEGRGKVPSTHFSPHFFGRPTVQKPSSEGQNFKGENSSSSFGFWLKKKSAGQTEIVSLVLVLVGLWE